jgi:hypothetical protein
LIAILLYLPVTIHLVCPEGLSPAGRRENGGEGGLAAFTPHLFPFHADEMVRQKELNSYPSRINRVR